MSKKRKRIVCLGGGTGLSMVLAGLRKNPVELSAIVSMFDAGAGSTGKLREELGVLPPGDIRQCLVTLSNNSNLAELFSFRFGKGILQGHSLGNLLIAAAEKLTGNFEEAVQRVSDFLDVKGRVIPVTLKNSNLKAILKNGQRLENEDKIVNCPYLSKIGIKKLFLQPKARANPKAISAIKKADLIVIGPGKFYTSLIPNLLVEGIREVIRRSRARKVFICNLMTQRGNTDRFGVEDFLTILGKYLGEGVIDYVIFNTGKLPLYSLREVRRVFPGAEFTKFNKDLLRKKNFIGTDILDRNIRQLDSADSLVKGANQRTMVLHHPQKLAKIILKLCR